MVGKVLTGVARVLGEPAQIGGLSRGLMASLGIATLRGASENVDLLTHDLKGVILGMYQRPILGFELRDNGKADGAAP